MGKFKNINDMKVDEDAEKDGIELSFGLGRFITITRAGPSNRKYKVTMAKVFKPHQSIGGVLKIGDDAADDLMKEVYADSVVTGWRGFIGNDDKEIQFNKKNCLELFNESPEIYDSVRTESAKFSNFARRDVEVGGKELPTI